MRFKWIPAKAPILSFSKFNKLGASLLQFLLLLSSQRRDLLSPGKEFWCSQQAAFLRSRRSPKNRRAGLVQGLIIV